MPRALTVVLVTLCFVFPPALRVGSAAAMHAWPTATPEEEGFDAAQLAEALLAIRKQFQDLHSVLLIRDGSIVVDASFYPYDGSTPHDLASVTKSVMTTLIGIAADQGKLRLEQPVLSFFPDRTIANVDDRKARLTVADLASMTSGLDCGEHDNEATLDAMRASPDWIQFALDRPMVAEPGSVWAYCNPDAHLLSAILTNATGMTALDFAWAYLFGPLEMRDVIWPADPQGYSHGWADLMLFPGDVAKLGQLWLNGGSWNGQPIVSHDWIAAAVTTQATTPNEGLDYGYGWWIDRESAVGDVFSARGSGGQDVVVIPALQIVMVITGVGTYGPGDVTGVLAPALIDPGNPLPPNPEGGARLTTTIANLSRAPAPTPVPPLPEIAQTISGRTYAFVPNPLGIQTLRLDFAPSAEATITIASEDDAGSTTLAVGLDGVYRLVPGDYGFPLGLRGAWVDARTFEFDYNAIANNEAILMRLRFEGNTVMIEARERTGEAEVRLEGTAVAP